MNKVDVVIGGPPCQGFSIAGKRIVDDERKPHENPTIGIVLCRDADKTYVEYLLQDYTQPMGVATYKVMPEKLKKILPPEEDFKRLLDGKEFDKSEK